MNHECPICNALLKELSALRRAVTDMSKTASGTYNEKRVSVDKKKMQRARDLAMTPIANLDYSSLICYLSLQVNWSDFF